MKVLLPFAFGRYGKTAFSRELDLRVAADVEDLLRWCALWSDAGLREVLITLQQQPQYAQNWDGTKRVIADIKQRLNI